MIRIHFIYGEPYKFQNWWINLMNNIDMNYVETDEEKLAFGFKLSRCIGGSWTPRTFYVDFDDEACYTLLLLKWS